MIAFARRLSHPIAMATLIEEMISDDVLNQALGWLCKQREHHSPNADVWWVRYHWPEVKADIAQKLNGGGLQFFPVETLCDSR